MTRPTAIAPTSIQHSKLHVQEIIDIASIRRPKPVALSMETSHKRGKSKVSINANSAPPKSDRTSKASSRDSTNNLAALQSSSASHVEQPPRSPVLSEISSTTAESGSTSSNPSGSGEPSSNSVNKTIGDSSAFSDAKAISAKTEVLQGGCLAGDQIPIKVTIKHTRGVKNMEGMVITLYRQGRIDTHPAIPLGPFRKGEKRRYEDYYPKSRTGLGGLSLSCAGSSRSFRQDLAQIIIPVIIDPVSLTAIINTSIEAPPHLFPSITDVPGAMVNFKYYVEIVVDLRGKLSGHDRIRPHLSMTNAPQHGYGDPKVSRLENTDGVNYHSAPAFNYLITDNLRRTRGVISTRTEIIIGTKDSTRKRGKQSGDRLSRSPETSLRNSVDLGREEEGYLEDSNTGVDPALEVRGWRRPPNNGDVPRSIIVPPPEPEGELDEKTRMRRAEERLLPSEPPQDDNPTSSTAPTPSAPPALDEEDFVRRYALNPPAPAYDGPSGILAGGQVPGAGPLQDPRSPQDDKQELERERLLALASSPDDEDDADADDAGAVRSTPRAITPSAPVLYQDDIFSINDPRIPESSPADFADERIPVGERMDHPETSASSVEAEPPHAPIQNLHVPPEHLSLADPGSNNTNDIRSEERNDDQDEHNEHLPMYSR